MDFSERARDSVRQDDPCCRYLLFGEPGLPPRPDGLPHGFLEGLAQVSGHLLIRDLYDDGPPARARPLQGALALKGHAPRSLLEDYAVERTIADRHVLDVSDDVHIGIMGIADAVREGREPPAATANPVTTALLRNSRVMIDFDYAESPLISDYGVGGSETAEPHPGQRYPDWTRFGGSSHHLLVFGTVADGASLARLDRRWTGLVGVSHDPDVDPDRAGVPKGGVVLIRPDGHIGFRFPSADAEALAALESHLSSYLTPDPTA